MHLLREEEGAFEVPGLAVSHQMDITSKKMKINSLMSQELKPTHVFSVSDAMT